MYFVYILKCSDSSLYCGWTNDFERRLAAHLGKIPGGARYTKSHPPTEVAAVFRTEDRHLSLSLERRIKNLTRAEKERLVSGETELSEFFPDADGALRAPELEGAAEGR